MPRRFFSLAIVLLVVFSSIAVLASSGWTPQGTTDSKEVYKAHILDASGDHYWIGATTDASVAANWQPAAVPATGDNIYFSALSTGNCVWALTGSYGSFNLLANFSRVVTQGASFSITSCSIAGGTLTGSVSYTLTDSGSYSQTGGAVTSQALNLVMSTDGSTLSVNNQNIFNTLTFNGNTVISSSNPNLRTMNLIVASGKTVTVTSPTVLYWYSIAGTVFTNNGIINTPSSSTVAFYEQGTDMGAAVTWGTIQNLNIILKIGNPSTTFTVHSSLTLTGTLTVNSGDATNTMTLDLSASNYGLTAAGITIGVRGILKAQAAFVTCSGNFDSSAGNFYSMTSTLIMSGTSNTLKLGATALWLYNLRIASEAAIGQKSNIQINATFIQLGLYYPAGYLITFTQSNMATYHSIYDMDAFLNATANFNRIYTAIVNLAGNVTAGIIRLYSAVSNLATNLTMQANRLNTAISNLATNLTTQGNRLNTAITNQYNNITTQNSRLYTEVSNLNSNLSSSIGRIYSEVSNLNSNATTINGHLTTENTNLATNLTTQANRLDTAIDDQMTNLTAFINSVTYALWITSDPVTSVLANETYAYHPMVNRVGSSALVWSLTTNATGLTVNDSTGQIIGKIKTTGTYWVNLTAMAGSLTVWQNFTLTVGPDPTMINASLVLALVFGFGLILLAFIDRKRAIWPVFGGFVWLTLSVVTFYTFGVQWMIIGIGIGLILMLEGSMAYAAGRKQGAD